MFIVNFFKSIIHWFSHKFGWNYGRVVTFEDGEFIYVAFECDSCKKIDEKSITKIESEKIYGK